MQRQTQVRIHYQVCTLKSMHCAQNYYFQFFPEKLKTILVTSY